MERVRRHQHGAGIYPVSGICLGVDELFLLHLFYVGVDELFPVLHSLSNVNTGQVSLK